MKKKMFNIQVIHNIFLLVNVVEHLEAKEPDVYLKTERKPKNIPNALLCHIISIGCNVIIKNMYIPVLVVCDRVLYAFSLAI